MRLLALLWALVFAAPALAQSVLIVDQARLFAESDFGMRVTRELEERSRDLTAENEKIAAALRAEEEKLTEERETLEPAEFRKLADAFDEKAQRIRAERAARLEALNATQEAEIARFLGLAVPILEQILREKNASVLLDRRAVLLSADFVDITTDAVARINARIGDGTDIEGAGAAAPAPDEETPPGLNLGTPVSPLNP